MSIHALSDASRTPYQRPSENESISQGMHGTTLKLTAVRVLRSTDSRATAPLR